MVWKTIHDALWSPPSVHLENVVKYISIVWCILWKRLSSAEAVQKIDRTRKTKLRPFLPPKSLIRSGDHTSHRMLVFLLFPSRSDNVFRWWYGGMVALRLRECVRFLGNAPLLVLFICTFSIRGSRTLSSIYNTYTFICLLHTGCFIPNTFLEKLLGTTNFDCWVLWRILGF